MEQHAPAEAPQGDPEPPGPTVPRREFRLLMAELRRWYEPGSAAEVRGGLGLLRGQAGSGKSLLAGALASALRRLGITGASARCRPERLPLEPVLGLLARLLEGRAGDPGPRIEPLAPGLRRLLPALPWPERLAAMPPLRPELERMRAVDVAARAFLAIGCEEALALVVEDLNWIDPLSRDVLAAVLRGARLRKCDEKPPQVLVVATLRRDAGEAAPQDEGLEVLLDPAIRAFEIEARGYSREDIRDRVAAAGIDLPLTVREALLRGTGGSPLQLGFYLQGMRPGSVRLPDLPDDPARFADALGRLVGRRLSGLDAREREAVEALSVVARPVPPELISSVAGGRGGGEAGRTAEDLATWLVETGWGRRSPLPGDGTGIEAAGEPIAAAVLRSLSPGRAAALRRTVSDSILAAATAVVPRPAWLGATPFCWAFHHLAGDPAHPRFLETGLQAAAEAEGLSSITQAVKFYEVVLGGLPRDADPARRAEVMERLARRLEELGADREALECWRRLAADPRPARSDETEAGLLRRIGVLHGRLGESDLESAAYREGLAKLTKPGESLERLKLYALIARRSLSDRPTEAGLPAGLEGEERLLEDPEYLEMLRLAEEVRFNRGEYVEALAFEDRIYARCIATGDLAGATRSARHRGHLQVLRGEARRAIETLTPALELARQIGSRFLEAGVLSDLGRAHRCTGEDRRALERVSEAIAIYRELGCEERASGLRRLAALLRLLLHDVDGAAATLEDWAAAGGFRGSLALEAVFPPLHAGAEARRTKIHNRRAQLQSSTLGSDRRAELLGELAEEVVDEGDLEEAGRLFREAFRLLEGGKDASALARLHQRAGRFHAARGDRGEALRHFEKGLQLLGAAPERGLLGSAYLEVAPICLDGGDAGKAHEYILRGFRVFLELGEDRGLVLAALRLGELFHALGRTAGALRLSAAALSLARGVGIGRWEAEALLLRGALFSEAGQLDESDRAFRTARDLIRGLGIAAHEARLRVEMGWEAYRAERYPEALKAAREGIDAARSRGMKDALEDSLFLLGVVETALPHRGKNFLRAMDVLHGALQDAKDRGRLAAEARILLAIARLYEERGKDDLGREYRARARQIAETLSSRLPAGLRGRQDMSATSRLEIVRET